MVLSGRADVPQGQQVGDLVVFRGSSTVDGSLTAFDAPVTIAARVNGDVGVAPIWWIHERLRAASPRRSSRATHQTALPSSVPR